MKLFYFYDDGSCKIKNVEDINRSINLSRPADAFDIVACVQLPKDTIYLQGPPSVGNAQYGFTWHHNAGQPFDEPFSIDLTSERLGESGWAGDNFVHPYIGTGTPFDEICIMYSNDDVVATLHIQEIIDLNFDYDTTPLLTDIGTVILPANSNGVVCVNLPIVGNSLIYYYIDENNVSENASDIRILGVEISN